MTLMDLNVVHEEIQRHEIQKRAEELTSLHEENVCPASFNWKEERRVSWWLVG